MENWLALMISVVSLVTSISVAYLTSRYVRLTADMVLETQKLREAQTEPSMVVYTQARGERYSSVYLMIENMGLGVARNVKCSINPHDYYTHTNYPLSSFRPFNEGISVAPPKYRSETLLLSTFNVEKLRELKMTHWVVGIKYTDRNGKIYEDNFPLDLDPIDGSMWVVDSTSMSQPTS